MPPAAWRPQGPPGWGWRGCGCASPRRCGPCAPPHAFPHPRSTSPSGRAPTRRGETTRRGWRGPGGGEGSELEVLERRWRGLGVEDAYRRRGEPEPRCCSWEEGDPDMGRRWRLWWRSGELERQWQGLGVGHAYRWRGEREARCRLRGEAEVDMGRRWRAWCCSGGAQTARVRPRRVMAAPGGSGAARVSK